MRFLRIVENGFKNLLPAPFTIAVALTILTFILAATLTDSKVSGIDRAIELMGFWEAGLWDDSLLVFAMQMMLMLVLGHVLALTPIVDKIISQATRYCTTNANSAAIVTFLTVLVSLFNWGLGLIFGAILARKVGEHAAKKHLALNYALIGAAGYSGLMVWHGGISGSAPIKVADSGHLHSLMSGILPEDQLAALPDTISQSQTIFGTMNLVAIGLVLVVLPLFMYWMGTRSFTPASLPRVYRQEDEETAPEGAERLDRSRIFSLCIGIVLVLYVCYSGYVAWRASGLNFITPNFINLALLAMALVLHRGFSRFLKAVDEAIGGASGILIQFPLYFGIMGIMRESGLVGVFSDFFVNISTEASLPVFTFASASLVNIFVPSGGGQWGVQGPIVIQSALQMGASLPKAVMALAYGDQLTNMLQPFWALPLLGITGLKARAILPYSVALMCVGAVIFIMVLILF